MGKLGKKFPFYKQIEVKDCGPACLKIISEYYGKSIPVNYLRTLSETTRIGSSLASLSDAGEQIGFRTIGAKIDFTVLLDAPLPGIVHWNKTHFIVVYKATPAHVFISDPAFGLIRYTREEFIAGWIGGNANEKTKEGIILLMEPRADFSSLSPAQPEPGRKSFKFIFYYLRQHKKLVFQLILGLLAASLLQLLFPFLMQSIVDTGIANRDVNFIFLVLLAQLMLFIGRISIEMIRGWILLHLSTRINISLVSDFFIKLMKLPIGFFDTRIIGDMYQRIHDQRRIEHLLTNTSLLTLFSLFNFFVFSYVLAVYNILIFSVFLTGSILNIIWVSALLKRRRAIDYKRFSQQAEEQGKIVEIITGMQEIKLNNAEQQKRWGWEFIQAKLFKTSIKSLTVEQLQQVGSSFIVEGSNILITFLSATLVLKGSISLGMMLSIQFIIGQLNMPVTQMITFIRSYQDAKISLERLEEIFSKEDEEPPGVDKVLAVSSSQPIVAENLSFRYPGSIENVLNDISFVIPYGKTTAIVGSSGSGKTTLVKLLLKFYDNYSGRLQYGDTDLRSIAHKAWRANSGIVMQEGFIFDDTIAKNIAVGEDEIDKQKLQQAVDIANIRDFIERLPLSYNTVIGKDGVGLSTGQKQRILIARAIYKSPKMLFFDEATSALDANNEKEIVEKLNTFLEGKTAIIVAHRLSTVKNAHQIIVIEKGRIAEVGPHDLLVANKNYYYNLIKNQLDLEKA